MPRQKKIPDSPKEMKYKRLLSQFHKASKRHVLVLEADLSEDMKRHIFKDSDTLRRCGNELISIIKNNIFQLTKTKRYRNLQRLYGKYSEFNDSVKKKEIASQLKEVQKEYNVTWDYCQKAMAHIKDKYNVPSVFALTRAEDIWQAVEKVLYSDSKTIRFLRYYELPSIRAKQWNKAIIMHVKDNHLHFSYNNSEFSYIDNDDSFVNEEIHSIIDYLNHSDEIDHEAVQKFASDKTCMDTYRPCYATLVCKIIRGRLRVYIHLTIEGNAKAKRTKDGQLRHTYREGRIGCDIGTQTVAYTAESEVGLENLGERGEAIERIERQKRLILRKMERSRRATNPDNYNEDGTVKKGRKTWHYSNHYRKLKRKYHDLCRKSAENRRFAINELVNLLRSLGNTIITEQKNFKALQKKAKPSEEVNTKGKPQRRKRFGKSIQNRSPGYLHAQLKSKFESTGGYFNEVPNDYRASQYDHTTDEYIKKDLSQRMFFLSDGTKVQRDWYSSFLLFCADETFSHIDREMCLSEFPKACEKEKEFVDRISRSGTKIYNSGIKA